MMTTQKETDKTLVPSRLIQFFNNFSDIVRLIKLNENFARSLPITATNIEENVVKKFNVKRKSSEGVPGAAKKRCMEVKDAVADRPAKRKSGEAGVKKSSSFAQPARPAEIRSAEEALAAVKKSRSDVKAAKPVKPANKIKSAEKVVGAVQKNRGGAKLVEPVRPDKVQAKLVSPKGKPNVNSARSPKINIKSDNLKKQRQISSTFLERSRQPYLQLEHTSACETDAKFNHNIVRAHDKTYQEELESKRADNYERAQEDTRSVDSCEHLPATDVNGGEDPPATDANGARVIDDELSHMVEALDSAKTYSTKVSQTSKKCVPKHRQIYEMSGAGISDAVKHRKRTTEKFNYLSDSSATEELAVIRDRDTFCMQEMVAKIDNLVVVFSSSCANQLSIEHAMNIRNNIVVLPSGHWVGQDSKKKSLKRAFPCTGINMHDSHFDGYPLFSITADFDYHSGFFVKSDGGGNTILVMGIPSMPGQIQFAEPHIPDDSLPTKDTAASNCEIMKTWGNTQFRCDMDAANDRIKVTDCQEFADIKMANPSESGSEQNEGNSHGISNASKVAFAKNDQQPYSNILPENKPKEKAKDRKNVQEESTDPALVTIPSHLTIIHSSILDCYREVFHSTCNRQKGMCCLRHADIPGLSRSSKVKMECSDLKVVVQKHVPSVRDQQQVISVKAFYCRSKTDEMRGYPDSDGSRKHVDAKANSVPETSRSPSIQANKYEIDGSFLQEWTLLLHALNFEAIIAMEESDSVLFSKVSQIPCLFIFGLSHFKFGSATVLESSVNHINKAKSMFLRCDELCHAFSKLGDSALCNLYLGDIQFLSRHFLDASTYYQKAISRYSSDTVAALFRMVPPSLSTIHSKHGSALRNASKMVDAIQQYKLAMKEAHTTKDRLAANTSLGNLYQSVGENTSALSHYQQSVELSEMLHDYVSLGWAHGNMGNAYLGLFQKDKAIFHLQKSLELTLQHETTPQAIGRAYNNLGTAYQSLGDLDKAQEHYEYAFNQAVFGNDKAGQARVSGNMGNILMLRKKYEEAVQQYTEVLSLSKDRSTISTAHHNRGCANYEWGETKMGEMYGEHVEQQDREKPAVLVSKYYLHGPVFKDISGTLKPRKVTETIAEYYGNGCTDLNEVVKFHEDHLENIKGSSKGLTLSVSLFETNSRTFHRLQDCFVNLGEYSRALLVAEQSRARTLGELMLKRKGWQLQNPLTSPMSFDHIVAVVACIDHPVFYLSYTGARLLGWVFVTKDSNVTMNMFEVPLKDDQFEGKSFDYHLRYSLTEALVERSFEMYREVGDYNEDTSAPVQTLYSLIAQPLLAILEKCGVENANKLVVISDSYTALLPYSSLHDPKTDTFLGDRFSFQMMPSLLTMGILNQLSDTNIVNLPEDDHCMCIVGNPNIPQFKYNDEIWNLGKLPHAKREAESVAHIMKTTPILEAQATKSAVLMRIMNAKIIHLATHGSASSGFLAFGMLVPMGQNEIAHSQGVLLYPEEVEKLNINPALVVLSSCDSGRGAVKADGIQGMARAFILAGAQAVLTTLWRVPDESAAIFMQFFYQYMMDGLESTKALQKAILSIRCFAKYSQYIHWSGYQLTGRDVYLKYAAPEGAHLLEKRLGSSSVFPRLEDTKLLELGLVDATCYPTDVQILVATPGLDSHEIVIDFIHSSYKQFSSGIFWINCEQPEVISSSILYIEKCLGVPLEQFQASELQQYLFVCDGISELPTSETLLQLLGNRYVHCVMLYHHYLPPDNLIRAIDCKLLRGCKVHHLEPLSMILSTQRIVYSMQKEINFTPKCNDQNIIEKISNFTCGSPILVNIVSRLLCSFINASQQSPQEVLQDFAKAISLNTSQDNCSSISDSLSSCSSSASSSPSFERPLSVRVSDSFSSISTLSPECRDEWDTLCIYDSWDSIAELLNICQFDSETKLLLDCLSHFGCGPIPVSIVSSLSALISKISGKTHLAGSLLSQLMDKGLMKRYPSPVIIYPNLNHQNTAEFVYMPKYISDCILKQMEYSDNVVALVISFQMLTELPTKCYFLLGLLKFLMSVFELNSDLMGENCYKEVYKLYLSHIYQNIS